MKARAATPPTTVDALLDARERKALRWTARARIAFSVAGLVAAIGFAGRPVEGLSIAGVALATMALQAILLAGLRRDIRLSKIGVLGSVADVLVVISLPLIWHIVYTTENEPLAHLLRHNLTPVSVAIVALNMLALRPLYPLIVGTSVVLVHGFLGIIAVTDPRLRNYPGGAGAAFGAGMGELDIALVTPLFLAVMAAISVAATRAARRTVAEAAELELAQHRLREQQLEALLEARLGAVAELVASVQHEVNNPIGALSGAADTASRASTKLKDALKAEDSTDRDRLVGRSLSALESSLKAAKDASARIAEVMGTIRAFVQLDRSEHQRCDLGQLVHTVLETVAGSFRTDTLLETTITDEVFVDGNARRITEAIATVVRNAAEAMDGPGKVSVELDRRDNDAELVIRDNGRGMTSEQVERLFDVQFDSKERVRARFGLPAARSIILQHGGELEIESEAGAGTKVTFTMPLSQ